jgi:hypothetical protein
MMTKKEKGFGDINNSLSSAVAFVLLFAACQAYCSTYFVDPNGNDTTGDGSIGSPFKTIPHALGLVVAGDTIYLCGGTHPYSSTINIDINGTPDSKFYLFAYPGERPVLDFSSMSEDSSNRGIELKGCYWYIKGIDIYRAGDNGMMLERPGSYNRIELCNFYENRDSGLQLANSASYNQIINCDSYYNRDINQGNADGFSPKLTVGTGNYFYGCRSWQNSDDGYDCYINNAIADDVTTTFENCWAFKSGYLKDGTQGTGNGNGFKMGSSGYRHNIILKNCLSFQNKADGFDQNHNLGSMLLYNCTSFSNGSGYNNFEISTAQATGKVSKVVNCVSLTGSVNLAYATQITNSWQGFTVNSSDFVSIDPSAAYGPRQADGNLPDITFMHLADGSDLIDGGTIDPNVTYPYFGTKPDLGCFEYYPGSPPGQASNPTPAAGATNVSTTQNLSWTADVNATSHDVYFGTESPGTFQGNQSGTTFSPGTLVNGTTYFWRIDEKNAGGTTAGDVWQFTTASLTIKKCTVKAGKTQARDANLLQDAADINNIKDYFTASGTGAFPTNREDINCIEVSIVSGDGNVIYFETIDFNDHNDVLLKHGKYSYLHRITKAEPNGAITSLKIDFSKSPQTFALTAKNINLTGLACPVELDFVMDGNLLWGDANEAVVNGKRTLIPTRLMRLYDDTLVVTKASAKHKTTPAADSLYAYGDIAVADMNLDSNEPNLNDVNVIVTWGDANDTNVQTFTIPAGSFLASKKGHTYKCSKINPDISPIEDANASTQVTATIDLDKCTFTASISKAKNLYAEKLGSTVFGIRFETPNGDFNEVDDYILP